MRRTEIFSLAAGCIGLVADLIALSHFVETRRATPHDADSSGPTLWFILLLLYGWFLVCWFVFQYARSRDYEHSLAGAEDEIQLLGSIVVATGVLLLPIVAIILYPLVWKFDAETHQRVVGLFFSSLIATAVAGGGIFVAVVGLDAIVADAKDF